MILFLIQLSVFQFDVCTDICIALVKTGRCVNDQDSLLFEAVTDHTVMLSTNFVIVFLGLIALGALQEAPECDEGCKKERFAAHQKWCATKPTDAEQKHFDCMSKVFKVKINCCMNTQTDPTNILFYIFSLARNNDSLGRLLEESRSSNSQECAREKRLGVY